MKLRNLTTFWLFLGCFFYHYFNLKAQQFEATPYRLAQGLVGEHGLEVLQDSSGFIWINTNNGISRFDGANFLNFKEYISDILITKSQKILAVTKYGIKEIFYRPDSISFQLFIGHQAELSSEKLHFPHWIYEDHQGALWITEKATLARLKDGKITTRFKTENRRLFFAEIGTEFLLMFSDNGEVFRFEYATERFEKLKVTIPMPNILALHQPHKNTIWLGGDKIIELQIKDKNLVLTQESTVFDEPITCFLQRQNGDFLAGSAAHFIYQIDTKNKFKAKIYGDLAENPTYKETSLTSLFEDRDQNLWVTSSASVSVLRVPTFAKVRQLPVTYYGDVTMLENGQKYVASEGLFKLILKDNGQFEPQKIPLAEHEGFINRAVGVGNQIFIGTNAAQILVVEDDKIQKTFDLSPRGRSVFNFMPDSRGNIWVIQAPKDMPIVGLLRFNSAQEITIYQADKGFTTNPLQAKEYDGTVYVSGIGAKELLFRYDVQTDSFVNITPELPAGEWTNFEVHDFEVISHEEFVFATTHGFFWVKNRKMRQILHRNPLFNTEIRSILRDKKDKGIWLSTNRFGLIKYYSDERFYLFNQDAGLANIMSYRALRFDKDGKLWVGTTENMYYQQALMLPQKTRTPIFLSLKMNDTKVRLTAQNQDFPYNTALEMVFILPNFPSNQVIYQERVYEKGKPKAWVTSLGNWNLRIPKFSAGKHLVEIRAKKIGAFEYSDVLRYEFQVDEIWYKTWWAFGIFMVLLSILVFIILKINQYRHRIIQHQLEKAVRERTAEVHQQNEELRQQHEELERQRDYVREKNEALHLAYSRIESDITASLEIQEAILPSEVQMQEALGNYFVFYRPKDIVSGDFYWVQKLETESVLVVADCTGHGVSGAFMTLIGNMFLTKIIKTENLTEPHLVLEELDKGIRKILKQPQTKSMNGMDVAIVFLTPKSQRMQLRYAGARRPILWVENGKLKWIHGTKRDVGGIQPIRKPFEKQVVKLSKDSMLYLGTDGFQDQNNAERKRYGSAKLLKLLHQIHALPLAQQPQRLEEELRHFAQNTEQRDDILWVGVRF